MGKEVPRFMRNGVEVVTRDNNIDESGQPTKPIVSHVDPPRLDSDPQGAIQVLTTMIALEKRRNNLPVRDV